MNKWETEHGVREGHEKWEVDYVSAHPKRGYEMHMKGARYPMKGLPTPEAITALGQTKRAILAIVHIFTAWQFRLVYPLIALSPKKFMKRVLDSLDRVAWGTMGPYLDYKHLGTKVPLIPVAREAGLFVGMFLDHLGIGDISTWKKVDTLGMRTSYRIGTLLAHILELDWAYRLRFQDLASSTNKEKLLANPRREVGRLIKLLRQREQSGAISRKTELFLNLLHTMLWVPSIRKAFRYSLVFCEYKNFCLDEGDYYWAAMRTDYSIGRLKDLLVAQYPYPKSEVVV